VPAARPAAQSRRRRVGAAAVRASVMGERAPHPYRDRTLVRVRRQSRSLSGVDILYIFASQARLRLTDYAYMEG
jgi:hypothetical protein